MSWGEEMFSRVLIANRGEIAIRIARACADLGIKAVAIYPQDDGKSLHTRSADDAVMLPGSGARAYLDIAAVVKVAKNAGCDAVHPGYGFLSENAEFARACAAAGLVFVGPSPETLETFGDKSKARLLAEAVGVPVISGTSGVSDLEHIKAFFAALPKGAAGIIKAIAGGGGRGMRIVREAGELEAAYAACTREALAAFGNGGVYAERLIAKARHIEVQIAGDGKHVAAIGERDCSLQRRHQKIVEIAPAPNLTDELRHQLHSAAVKLCEAAGYRTVGTVEFLLDADNGDFAFIETNARLQVEHTITEEVTGVDLVRTQFELASGKSLADLKLSATPPVRGFAIQARVNLEKLGADGRVLPAGGRIDIYEPPTGPNLRVDGYGYAGYVTSPNYDSLLAKVIAKGPTFAEACARTERALSEFRIDGTETNIPLLRAVVTDKTVIAGAATTRFIEANAAALLEAAKTLPSRTFDGAEIAAATRQFETVDGAVTVAAPLQSTVGPIDVKAGDLVRQGQQLLIVEAMKMEHVVHAEVSGRVVRIAVATGDVVLTGQPLVFVSPEDVSADIATEQDSVDLDHIRPDLAEALERWRLTRDEARPKAVASRRKTNQRTARENVDDLVDPGSFIEYGAFALANQRHRRTEEELKKMSPGDGMICGVGTVNGALFPPEQANCVAISYDYTVLAGTQGNVNHLKTDRILHIAHEQKLPVVFYTEGGGGRPGDQPGRFGGTHSFSAYARLSGEVPKIAIASRYCFAGNASMAGMSEILIATKDSNLGMAGPAMIEGGGMGVFKPTEIGPVEIQRKNGVIDIVAEDEADATRLAKKALSYFQGRLKEWTSADQRLLRRCVPENRLRVYDVRPVIEILADTGSFLEIRRDFALGMICGFMRVEGRPVGVIANDNRYLGGAIDCDGSDKASRFLQLCDNFNIPVLSLVDNPGFMVGLESEAQAAVRKTSRLFIAARKLGVPLFSVVLRKCYGLGGIAMTAGSMEDPMFTVSWPTGEFGGMGLEGAVNLAYRNEMNAEPDPIKRKAIYDLHLGRLYAAGKAVQHATYLRVDAVIDPADTRRWLLRGLVACPTRRDSGPRGYVDAW
jgi:acetyl/propionyl-CoA carboxylase alpha subunit/acetyl-CoA carboxylase carboxyltransferase component